jgi:bacillithiol system protein YtxJ
MSFFDKILGGENPSNQSSLFPWIHLERLSELNTIEQLSRQKAVVIFKHSTRCSISKMALKQFENEYSIESSKDHLYFLDLLEHRDISNEIATRFHIIHQSPQLLLIKNGSCVYNASHEQISALELNKLTNQS